MHWLRILVVFLLFCSPQILAQCTVTITPNPLEVSSDRQNQKITINTAPTNCTWTATINDSWITPSFGPSGGNGGTMGFTVANNPLTTPRTGTITITPNSGQSVPFTLNQDPLSYAISGFVTPAVSGVQLALAGSATASTLTDANGNYAFSGLAPGGTYTVTPSLTGYTISPLNKTFANLAANQSANFTLTLTKATISGQVTVSGLPLSNVTINVNGPTNTSTTTGSDGKFSLSLPELSTYTLSAALTGYSFSTPITFNNLTANQTANFTGIAVAGLEFYPVTPCRLVDTRVSTFTPGFGPPALAAGETRALPIQSSPCGIPITAKAYSLNVTVVTRGYLGYLTLWPAGQSIPNVSTLNSYAATSTAVANAAIVPAGTNGAISVYATDPTDLIIDINGYFGLPLPTSLQFYPLTPCRLADTRVPTFPTGFGPPSLLAQSTRTWQLPNNCAIPSNAKAYSLNITAIPQTTLGALIVWPAGLARPDVSTLNVYSPHTVVANAAIVPGGTNGAISTYVTDPTDLVIDVNGYFAAASSTGQQFFPATPCRIADTRVDSFPSGLGPPLMTAGTQRTFLVPQSSCGIPSGAGAYSFNFTALPHASQLGIFSTWPAGRQQPKVSTLNSYSGAPAANAAIVPAGTSGGISIFVTDNADVLFDINGYFAIR